MLKKIIINDEQSRILRMLLMERAKDIEFRIEDNNLSLKQCANKTRKHKYIAALNKDYADLCEINCLLEAITRRNHGER